ncbi:MAG: hypothetical protein ACLSHV_11450 [Hominisplanchenecus sp.]
MKTQLLSGIYIQRVCPALCEAACTCNLNGDPVCHKGKRACDY